MATRLNLSKICFIPKLRTHQHHLNDSEFNQNSNRFYPDSIYNPSNYINFINYNTHHRLKGYNQPENNQNKKSLEYLLSTPQIEDSYEDNEEKKEVNLQLKYLIRAKEDLVYYFSSPESLLNFKSCLEEEFNYKYYIDLDFYNFIIAQKERIKLILSISNSDIDSQIKIKKLGNYNTSFCVQASQIENISSSDLIKTNLIRMKLDEFFVIYSDKAIGENKLIDYLNELKGIFLVNVIDMKSLGLISFNFIESNMIHILELIERKLTEKNNIKNLTSLLLACLDILKSFKSTKLYFYIIKFLKSNKKYLDFPRLNSNKELIKFVPNNCFDFNLINTNIKEVLVKDLIKQLINRDIIKNSSIDINDIFLNLKDYITLNYEENLLCFIGYQKNLNIQNKGNILFCYKIDLIHKNIIDITQINLLNIEDDKNNDVLILDINISLKNEVIYLFYITLHDKKSYLKYKLYNKDSFALIKEGKINLEENFFPINLYNDNKYLYCVSDMYQILIIKKNNKIDIQKYVNCSFRLYEDDLMFYTELKDLSNYEMYNSLYINNLFFLRNKKDKKVLMARILYDKNKNYILNIYDTSKQPKDNETIKIAYNNCKFIITKIEIDLSRNDYRILYDMTSKDFNHLIDLGIALLPFDDNISNYYYPDNLDEYLIQEYSSFLNLCGNFDLINKNKQKNLIKYPFTMCCNFDPNILYFIIDNIIENGNSEEIKMDYMIILKQIICSLYHVEMLNEKVIKKLIPFFKNIILNVIESKKKKSSKKIINEIFEISIYFQNDFIINFDEIKIALDDNDINIKTKIFLIELILKQSKIRKSKDLYEYIIKLEKIYLSGIFNAESIDSLYLSNYHLIKKFMINSSESLYKRANDIKNELISLIPCILENVQILIELYQKKIKNNNKKYEDYYFLYNSFIFRSFYFIIEYFIAHKIFIRKVEFIIQIYKILLMLDNNDINYNDCFIKNNIIEIKNNNCLNPDPNNNFCYFDDDNRIVIKFKNKQNLIFKTNLMSEKKLKIFNEMINIKLNSSTCDNIKVKYYNQDDNINRNISEIKIDFMNNSNNNFIINIIPLKNEKLFNSYKKNKNYKIISLIEQTTIHYLLSLFDDINSDLENYNNKPIIKKYKKIFELDIFKHISISKNISLNEIQSQSEFNDINNEFLEKIKNSYDNDEDFNILNKEIISNFNMVNKDFSKNNKDIKYNKIKIFSYNHNGLFEEIKCDKLFELFNEDLFKKIKYKQKNSNVNSLIKQIFLFAIKYYNYYEDLITLVKEIEKNKNKKTVEIKNYIEKNNILFDIYSLFYSLYEKSSKIQNVYHEHKNKFKDEDFEKEDKKYFDGNFEKLKFLYSSIIPCNDYNTKPNGLIIHELIELIDNSKIGISDMKQYFKIQNINSRIKLIQLFIINNLLLNLNNENNMIFILNFMKNSRYNNNKVLNSIFDNTYGIDYIEIENLKNQFYLFLNIISNKVIDRKNNYSVLTKISLIENLIFKIRERDFPILYDIMIIFEEIKNMKLRNNNGNKNDENLLSIDIKNNSHNIIIFNEKTYVKYQFNIFTILVNQIINTIKNLLKNKMENKDKLLLKSNFSNILENDFAKILKKIVTFFVDINQELFYYYDIILMFYKIFINSKILLDFLITNEPNVIIKIIEIVFDNNNNGKDYELNNNDNEKKNNIRLIMIKLLCQIIENINENNIQDFSEIIGKLVDENSIITNPFIYLYEKSIKELNEKNQLEIIFEKYLIKLIIILINQNFKYEKNKMNIKK